MELEEAIKNMREALEDKGLRYYSDVIDLNDKRYKLEICLIE